MASEMRGAERMKTTIGVLTVLALIGCGGSAGAGAEPEQPRATAGAEHGQEMHDHGGGMHGQMMQGSDEMACPMMLEGAEVSVENIDQGVAMTFTTDRSEDVPELRERVRGMATMHEQHAGMMEGGMMGGQGGMSAMPPSTVSVVDVPQGARLELVASEAADVDSLRQHASMHAEHMRGRQGCPMMGAPAA